MSAEPTDLMEALRKKIEYEREMVRLNAGEPILPVPEPSDRGLS